MSLDYNTTAMKQKPDNGDELYRMCLMMMSLGLTAVEADGKYGADELYWRWKFAGKMFGWETDNLTLADCEFWIGLRTNVSYETRAAFKKRLIASVERNINHSLFDQQQAKRKAA